jgi:hypothetical protein
MTAAQPLSLKKGFLYALIGSVSCSALLGIAAILIGDFGEFEIRILLTTLTISAASVCGLSCGAVLEAGRKPLVPVAGIALSLLAAVLIILGIWAESERETYWKATASCGILAVASSHVALLLLARLSPRFAWAQPAAHVAVYFVALIFIAMIWGDFDDGIPFQVLGIAAILDAAITIVIPVLHRLSRGDLVAAGEVDLARIDDEIRHLESRLAELRQIKASAGEHAAPRKTQK